MSNWKEYKLVEVAKNASRRFDFSKHSNVIFINTGDVLNNQFLHKNYSIADGLPGQAKKAIQKGDILYSEIRPGNGRYLLVGDSVDDYVVSTKFMVIESNQEIILPEFLFLLLISNEATEYFKVIAESRSGTFPQITFDSISHYELKIPSKDIQQSIVDNIFVLDKKIELNTQINQTLEQIAQTIFKSWFIDFDPVHAKANALASGQTAEQATQAAMAVISGKNTQELHRLQTANPEQYQQLWEIADAFPSGVDEEGVPWGWEERYLKDVCNIVYGKGLPKNKLTEKGFYVFGANGVIGFYDSYTYEKPQVLIGCRGTVGQVTLSYPYSFVTNNSLVIEYENSCVSMYYLEKYLSNINLKEISSGSVQPQITIQNMSKVKILIPNIEILNFYSEKVKEIYDKRLHHFYENQSLSKVRDLLLPKLLSGEV
ncbi:restriction endonuclease subunit S [Glaesserella parasuis]|uniref:restriction endonuclease subunit S n=1 Tax=Glaesserella parasuis TaxID=738 RepID=UPI00136569BE|nr:restriction endonuclease subunit S [Glaesserella parasuis]MDO9658790.1 restriction endonuclease subunit S [Glaesserella parasuis]MDO9667601.1 restriction endonuclease subunit S [Glaesserella parasuis]MDO9738977.1 restriction endonuclease subunit S [Glaesserella parasuis]MDO9776229.1 restriction endonuclease subunit S [Glaesserella parasuis]